MDTDHDKIIKIEERLIAVDEKVDSLIIDFKYFTSNCFEHFKNDIYNKMEKLKGVSPSLTIILSLFSAIITGLAVYLLTK